MITSLRKESKIITSRENSIYKRLLKISKLSKARQKTNQTLLDGEHLVSEYIESVGNPEVVIVKAAALTTVEILKIVKRVSAQPIALSDSLFKSISHVDQSAGILALINIPNPSRVLTDVACIILEDIQDPGNMGSILRSAAACGLHQVHVSANCVDVWAPKTLRAGMGAQFRLNIHMKTDIQPLLQRYHGKVFATTPIKGISLYDVDLRGPVAFLFGNEGAGLSSKTLKLVTKGISIPMEGKTESLNVAAAAAICFFERARQICRSC